MSPLFCGTFGAVLALISLWIAPEKRDINRKKGTLNRKKGTLNRKKGTFEVCKLLNLKVNSPL
jgi:hypothetical protein